MLPTIPLAGLQVTRLIVGGNPVSGNSHQSPERDWEMARWFTQERVLALLAACQQHGINTMQMRADAFIMRAYLEHRERGGTLQWIAQTATEMADLRRNMQAAISFGAAAIYLHGSHTDRLWHAGEVAQAADYLKLIHDLGVPAGLGTHIPEVVAHAEEQGWETDFYMCCFYNLSRRAKDLPTVGYARGGEEQYLPGDPDLMTAVMRATRKPCLGFKILGAGRRCGSPEGVREAFAYAFAHIKPSDAVVVGMFPRDHDQVAENAALVRALLL